ncbi:ribonuclease 1-like [Coffea eugenioides]|uniref:ribonuclease 1-like n=1 Tax=Coffea eugenioides TaxID=49369 RepID=UPI000F60FD2B|nr:ribonuclease 1-like [Coffea eugenioides]
MEKTVKIMLSAFIMLLVHASLPSTISSADNPPDFFYVYLKWPGSQCATKEGCCLKKTPKPARDFIITGFQPYYFNGTWPENCDPASHLDVSKISHLRTRLEAHWPSLTCPGSNPEKLWSDAWKKYGTCSKPTLKNQQEYFRQALAVRKSANLLKILGDAGIRPDGSSYPRDTISDTIIGGGLHFPGLACSTDKDGNSQLDQVILCTGSDAKTFTECPGNGFGCDGDVKFPHF